MLIASALQMHFSYEAKLQIFYVFLCMSLTGLECFLLSDLKVLVLNYLTISVVDIGNNFLCTVYCVVANSCRILQSICAI